MDNESMMTCWRLRLVTIRALTASAVSALMESGGAIGIQSRRTLIGVGEAHAGRQLSHNARISFDIHQFMVGGLTVGA